MGAGDNKSEIPTKPGRVLEGYKKWYYQQPKLLRAGLIPFIVAIFVAAIEAFSLEKGLFWIPGMLLAVNSYNQYLDSLLTKNLETIEKQKEQWKTKTDRLLQLNNMLQQLVNRKSEMFITAAQVAMDEGKDAGIQSIRTSGSLKPSIDRILGILNKVFSRYADNHTDQRFRTAYLAPDEHDENRLIAKSWFNDSNAPPTSTLKPNPQYFAVGDNTTAGHLWGKNGDRFILIDDVQEHITDRQGDAIFRYTNADQDSYIRSIMCYKVMEPEANVCLGILCVDTNKANTLKEHKSYCKTVMETFAQRILFETRCQTMKDKLG